MGGCTSIPGKFQNQTFPVSCSVCSSFKIMDSSDSIIRCTIDYSERETVGSYYRPSEETPTRYKRIQWMAQKQLEIRKHRLERFNQAFREATEFTQFMVKNIWPIEYSRWHLGIE